MKKILVSVMVIAMVAGLIGAGISAFFSDTETSTGNTFTAGTLDLQVKDNNEGWGDGVTATWTMSNMKPGDELTGTVEQVDLRNVGSVSASTVDITVINTVIDPPGPESDTEAGTTDMDWFMEVTWMEYEDGTGVIQCLALFSDVNSNGWKDLDDLENDPITGLPAPMGTGRFQLNLRFHPSADNDFQGDTLVSDFVFTLNQ